MNVVDALLVTAMLVSMALGAWRGFLYEVFSLAGWVVAFLLAKWFAADAAAYLPLQGASDAIKTVAGFLAVFIASAFGFGLVSWLVRKLAEKVGLRPVDRVLGSLFGMARGVVLLVFAAFVVGLTPWARDVAWTESRLAQVLVVLAEHAKVLLPEEFLKVVS
jgi:membrane protein required for colicin V production